MENNSLKIESVELNQKISNLESNVQEIRAFMDQKMNQFENDLETLESRINNLR